MSLMEQTAQQARYRANADTALGNLNQKIGLNTKRMAGAAFAGAVLPGTLALIDNQESDFLGNALSGSLSVAGIGAGGYLGYKNAHVAEDAKDDFLKAEIKNLKDKSKAAAKIIGPQAAVEQFAREKQALLEDLAPIDPKRAAIINRELGRIPELGMILKDMDLGNKAPRDVRGIAKGALIGALASIAPAYLALRGGEIED